MGLLELTLMLCGGLFLIGILVGIFVFLNLDRGRRKDDE
jgi:hypothetical protein